MKWVFLFPSYWFPTHPTNFRLYDSKSIKQVKKHSKPSSFLDFIFPNRVQEKVEGWEKKQSCESSSSLWNWIYSYWVQHISTFVIVVHKQNRLSTYSFTQTLPFLSLYNLPWIMMSYRFHAFRKSKY